MTEEDGLKAEGAFDEPTRPSTRSLPGESGAEDARTPDASRLPGVFEPREASGVRPIYRRFPSGAGRFAVHVSMHAKKRKRAFHERGSRRLTAAATFYVPPLRSQLFCNSFTSF